MIVSMRAAVIAAAAAVSFLAILAPAGAEAQWVMIGRKSMGAIQNIRSEHSDVATVVLEAPAAKVYAAALRALSSKEGVKIKGKDDGALTIDFSRKRMVAKMKVGSLGDNVSILTITSPGTVRRQGDASPVVDGVLRVCREMKVECRETTN